MKKRYPILAAATAAIIVGGVQGGIMQPAMFDPGGGGVAGGVPSSASGPGGDDAVTVAASGKRERAARAAAARRLAERTETEEPGRWRQAMAGVDPMPVAFEGPVVGDGGGAVAAPGGFMDIDPPAAGAAPGFGSDAGGGGVPPVAGPAGGGIDEPMSSSVPETATWLTLVAGMGLTGLTLRRRKGVPSAAS